MPKQSKQDSIFEPGRELGRKRSQTITRLAPQDSHWMQLLCESRTMLDEVT
jgi:hypothetical protein